MKKKTTLMLKGSPIANHVLFSHKHLYDEKEFKSQTAEFKALLKNKEIIKFIKLCEWIVDKNPRFKEICNKLKSLHVNVCAAGLTVVKLVSSASLPDHIRGKVLKEVYPNLARKIKKFHESMKP